MSNLQYYLGLWALSDPRPLAITPTSSVYTVTFGEARAILKLLTPVGMEDERNGALALHYFDGQGAVRLYREDEQAHLLEYADGEDLTELVKNGQDEQATAIIAEVLNKLHNTSAELNHMPPLTRLDRRFRSLFQKAASDQNIDSLFVWAARVAEQLLCDPRDLGVLHGDIHHGNIRRHSERGWLAFDPKGLYGEKTYDAANALCNPVTMPELVENEARLLKHTGILADKMEIERSRLLAFVFAYACLSASWSLEDGDDPRHALKMAELAESHVSI